jgi:Zn finger protein HypA/HybF involved in hydrogenase expression
MNEAVIDVGNEKCEKCGSSNVVIKQDRDISLKTGEEGKHVLIKNVGYSVHCSECGHVQNPSGRWEVDRLAKMFDSIGNINISHKPYNNHFLSSFFKS